jgi:hypothetical protein
VKGFTLTIIMALGLHLAGFSQVGVPISAREPLVKLIRFYPNPATTIINFEFQKGYDKTYSFQIYNLLGKKVYELKNVATNNQVNLTEFTRGVYIFQLRDNIGRVLESGKFQVSK